MIKMHRFEYGITVEGHAGFAEPGEDIVCAAVSTLVQTLIASFEVLTEDLIQYDIQPGWVDIKFKKLSKQARVLVDSFFIGIEMIADSYPSNVWVSPGVEDEKSNGNVQAWNT